MTPYIVGALAGGLVGCALGRDAKNPRRVIAAGTIGGALGGILHWGLLILLASSLLQWTPGEGRLAGLIRMLVFWGWPFCRWRGIGGKRGYRVLDLDLAR